MTTLSIDQIKFFQDNGYLVVEDAVDPVLLEKLRNDFAAWVADSKDHSEAYGTTINGRPRFDVESGHSSESPALRRVCLLYTSPSPRDKRQSRMPSSA